MHTLRSVLYNFAAKLLLFFELRKSFGIKMHIFCIFLHPLPILGELDGLILQQKKHHLVTSNCEFLEIYLSFFHFINTFYL